jgi:hypothetical protein
MLENSGVGFAILGHKSPAHRAAAERVPGLVRESREIANVADSLLRAGECSAEQCATLHWRVTRNAAHAVAISEELLAAKGLQEP